MSGEQLRNEAEQELHNEISAEKASLKNQKSEVPPSVKAEVATETQQKLDTIKKEIESGKFGMESLKTHLDALNEINNSDMKSIYLGSIITALNKKGFYVLGFNQKGINLAGGYQINGKTAPGEEVEGYETILNNYMKSGSFTKADFQKAMLYRSSEMKNFISQNTDSTGRLLNSPNVDQYAVHLLKKYPDLDQNIQKDPEGGLMYVEKDEKIYTNWKQAMREKIKENPEDADFLVSYFDSKFYGSQETFAGNESPFESYKSTSQEIKTKLDTFTNSFTNEELYSLGIRNPSELEQFKTSVSQDPIGTLGESIRKGSGWGFIGALIGLIFGKGFTGKLLGALGGFGIAAALGGNTALAKEALNNKSGAVESTTNAVSETFEKFKGYFSDASEPQQKILEDILGKESKFLTAPASVLNIFSDETFKTFEDKKAELAKYGIELTEDNKADYEEVFAGLIKNRADANIHIQGTETVNEFFTKRNDVADTTGAAGNTENETQAEPEVSQPELQNSQKEYSEEEKTEILKYFKINNPELLINLKTLGLNPFSFLDNYKNFIETNLSGFNHKEKIILSIQAKLNVIQTKIEELKQQELDNYGDLNQFKNNRWIVNSLIIDLFEQTNTQVLPGAFLLQNETKINGALHFSSSKDKFVELKNMFNSSLTDDGDFDKTWSSFEIWDASTNNWNIFNTTDDQNIFQQAGWSTNSLAEISLLNEQDKEIEEDANLAYLLYVGASVIPFVGLGASLPSDVADLLSDEEGVILMLKQYGLINGNYRTDKSYVDNIMGGVGIVLSIFGFQALAKGKKVAKAAEISQNIDPVKAEKVATKMGINKETLDKILSYFKQGKTSDTPVSEVNRVEPVINNIVEIKNTSSSLELNRASGKDGLPTGEFVEYQSRYKELYTKLDNNGIYDSTARGVEIKKLDDEIAQEIVSKRTANTENISHEVPPNINNGETAAAKVDEVVEATTETAPATLRTLNKNEKTVYSDIARKQIGSLGANQSQIIAGVEVRNTGKTGKLGGYIYDFKFPDGTIKEGSIKDFEKYSPDYSKIPDEIRNSGKITNIIHPSNKDKTVSIGGEKLLGVFTIKNNKVSIEGDTIKVVTADKTVLQGQAYDDFMNQHFHEILKGFGVKLDKIPNTKLEAMRIKATDYSKKLNELAEKTKNPGKFSIWRTTLQELTQPIRTSTQLLDILANSSGFKGRGKDLAELLILGDRSRSFKKLSDYQRLGYIGGIASTTTIVETTFLGGEADASDIGEAMIYNILGFGFGGVVNYKYIED